MEGRHIGKAKFYDPTIRVWHVEIPGVGEYLCKVAKYGQLRANIKKGDLVVVDIIGNRAFIAYAIENDEDLDEAYKSNDFIVKHDNALMALYSEGTFRVEITPLASLTLTSKNDYFSITAQNFYVSSTNWKWLMSSIAGIGDYKFEFSPLAQNILDKYAISMDLTGLSIAMNMGLTNIKIEHTPVPGKITIKSGFATVTIMPTGAITVEGVTVDLGKIGIPGSIVTTTYTPTVLGIPLIGSPTCRAK